MYLFESSALPPAASQALRHSQVITVESSPLHIGSSGTETGNLWFPSASRQLLNYAPLIFVSLKHLWTTDTEECKLDKFCRIFWLKFFWIKEIFIRFTPLLQETFRFSFSRNQTNVGTRYHKYLNCFHFVENCKPKCTNFLSSVLRRSRS